jgi:hypothetical protein
MTYEFDEGNTSSEAIGPFLNWHARETLDGEIPSRTFSVRTEDGRTDVTAQMKKGVAFDLEKTLKTGWCFSDGTPGIAPEWLWNDTPARFNVPQPADRGTERWKKGFSVRVALNKGDDGAVTWSQAGAGAWAGLVNLMREVKQDGGSGETVVAALSDVEEIKFKKGGTSAPIFTIKKWAPRPECLEEQIVVEEIVEEAVEEFVDEF